MKNTILFSKVDREDLWVSGLAFKVKDKSSYESAFNEVKEKMQTKEMIAYITEEWCLVDDYFDGNERFTFKNLEWDGCPLYIFVNGEEECHFRLRGMDFIYSN